MVPAPSVNSNAQDFARVMTMKPGFIVQEIGWDDDCDSTISESIEDAIGEDLLDEDADDICDAIILWWRDDDGDLVDALVDCTRNLAETGRIWLLTPAAGSSLTVDPGVISESAQLAGLVQTKAERLNKWQGSCLVARGQKRNA